MSEITAEQLAQKVVDLDLLDDRQIKSIWSELDTVATASEFRAIAVRREFLTNYQVDRLLKGERTGFYYGDYKVLYRVGTGTFARVYRAVHRNTNEIVAVKVLRKRFSDQQTQKAQFLREGRMMRSLQHANIVPIRGVHSQGTSHYLVMDFIEGRNLREFLKVRKQLAPDEATRLLADVASGLSYAFERGITHRDLKLSNILVSSLGRAHLVDFGLAAGGDVDSNVNDCPNPRTIDYAGLERASGVRRDDQRSDIFFLGCIYYHMLSGKPALFETKDRVQRLSITRFQNIVPITKVAAQLPRSVVKVVQQAMELNPNRRYKSPMAVLEDLQKAARSLMDAQIGLGESASLPDDTETESQIDSRVLEGESRTVMIVESNIEVQNILRDRLKRCGYRVLVISDPGRAINRLEAFSEPDVDCVIFSTADIGASAVEAFNRLATGEYTSDIPAILLLGKAHSSWKDHAKLDEQHVAMSTPIRLGELRKSLRQLIPKKDK